MEQLIMGMKQNDKSFSVVMRSFDGYNQVFLKIITGDILCQIRFSSPQNYYASVCYKNLTFHGRILSKNEWYIYDTKFHEVVYKKNNYINIKTNKNIQKENSVKEDKNFNREIDLSQEYEYLKPLYESVILKYNDLYKNIQDKDEFESQLFEYL